MGQALYLLASAGNLFLASIVILRARRARGALPVAFLCIALFVWAIAEAATDRTSPALSDWPLIRLMGSSMAPAFLWHFVVLFTRREKTLRKWVVVLYLANGAFAATTGAALFSVSVREVVAMPLWHLLYLVVLLPFLVGSLLLVRRRIPEVDTEVERNAVRFVGLGIAVGTFAGLTELARYTLTEQPWGWAVGAVGSLMCTIVLAIAIFRHRLLDEQTPVRKLLFTLLLVASAAFVMVVLYWALPGPGRWDQILVIGAVGAATGLALYRFLFLRLTEQAERRKRLALIGTMAAGVAHEVRNPLASIKGATQFVQKELEGAGGKEEARDYLKLIIGEVDRLNDSLESFLSYARPVEPKRQPVRLEEFLADLVRLQRTACPEGVTIETHFDPDLPAVEADPALLTQAVTNVLRNGVEAAGEAGRVVVRTRGVMTALRTYAAVEVSDSGPGVPADQMDRIFQPFHTTKSRGTGLGLAIAARIVEAHGGELAVENLAPAGCRFTFYLPFRIL